MEPPALRLIVRALLVGMAMWGWTWNGPAPQVKIRTLPKYTVGEAGDRTIFLNRSPGVAWTWQRICQAVSHEWGHLAGRAHSRNPRSIMYPVLAGADPRCTHWRAYLRRRGYG